MIGRLYVARNGNDDKPYATLTLFYHAECFKSFNLQVFKQMKLIEKGNKHLLHKCAVILMLHRRPCIVVGLVYYTRNARIKSFQIFKQNPLHIILD